MRLRMVNSKPPLLNRGHPFVNSADLAGPKEKSIVGGTRSLLTRHSSDIDYVEHLAVGLLMALPCIAPVATDSRSRADPHGANRARCKTQRIMRAHLPG